MATKTFTAGDILTSVHPVSGTNWAFANFSGTITSTTASDRFIMLKLPAGAIVCDGYIQGVMGPSTGTVFKIGLLGTSASTTMSATFATSLTLSGTSQLRRFTEPLAAVIGTVSSSSTVTMGVATPGTVTWTAHGFLGGEVVRFTTTGALLTGLAPNTNYWITKVDADTFNVSTSIANYEAGTLVAFSGTQSGVHTGSRSQSFTNVAVEVTTGSSGSSTFAFTLALQYTYP